MFETNEVIRRAHAIVKGLAIIYPIVTTDDSVNDPENALAARRGLIADQRPAATVATSDEAYGKLLEKAEELRKADSSLSEAAAFSKVYQDPANAHLAQAERRQARARLG